MPILLDNIGNTFRVSAKAPTKQPVNTPPKRKNIYRNVVPRCKEGDRRKMIFPKVTPSIMATSMFFPSEAIFLLVANFSNTPSKVIKATYPADIPRPASMQKRKYNISLMDINGFPLSFTVCYNASIYSFFILSHLHLKRGWIVLAVFTKTMVEKDNHSSTKSY